MAEDFYEKITEMAPFTNASITSMDVFFGVGGWVSVFCTTHIDTHFSVFKGNKIMEWFLDDDHHHRHCHEDHYDTDSALMRMIIMIADCWSWINLGIILLSNPHRPGQSKTWDQSIGKGFKTCNPNAQCLSVLLFFYVSFNKSNLDLNFG